MGTVTLTWTNTTNPNLEFEQKVYRADAVFIPGENPEDPEVLDVDNLNWGELVGLLPGLQIGTYPYQYSVTDNNVDSMLTTEDKVLAYKIVCSKDALETISNITQVTIPANFSTIDDLEATFNPQV